MLIEGNLILADRTGAQHLAVYTGSYMLRPGPADGKPRIVDWVVETRWNGHVRVMTSQAQIGAAEATGMHHRVGELIVHSIKGLVALHRGGQDAEEERRAAPRSRDRR